MRSDSIEKSLFVQLAKCHFIGNSTIRSIIEVFRESETTVWSVRSPHDLENLEPNSKRPPAQSGLQMCSGIHSGGKGSSLSYVAFIVLNLSRGLTIPVGS